MFDAIVLAGGSARRLGGLDKAAIEVGGITLLNRALEAVRAARRIVVVGPQRSTSIEVEWAQEDPPGGGPAAAVAAGMSTLGSGQQAVPAAVRVAVLAADIPFAANAISRLLVANPKAPAALAVDSSGHDQYLIAIWRAAALRQRINQVQVLGASMRMLFDGMTVTRVLVDNIECFDCDTAQDVSQARALARRNDS